MRRLAFIAFLIFIVGCYYARPPSYMERVDYLNQGKKSLKSGDCNKAIKLLREALKSQNKKFQTLFWLGVSEAMCGDYPSAYKHIQKALGYAPSQKWTARLYATTGFIFLLIDKRKEAEVYFKLSKETGIKTDLLELFNEDKLDRKSGFEVIMSWM